jgi:hypothetical protein
VSQDDDKLLIVTGKVFIVPQFCCKQTYDNPNQMQFNMPTTSNQYLEDPIPACHSKGLSTASQNAHYNLQVIYRLPMGLLLDHDVFVVQS